MTRDEIVAKVAGPLGLLSDDAKTRIADEVNDYYQELTTSIGLQPSVRRVVEADSELDSQYITFGDADEHVQKIFAVYDPARRQNGALVERTYEFIRDMTVRSEPPDEYAVSSFTDHTVTLILDCVASADASFTLEADAVVTATALDADDSPVIPESFHDVFVHYGKYIEYLNMENKAPLAKEYEKRYMKRESDLRFFIIKSAYLRIYQGLRRGGDVLSMNSTVVTG